MLDIFASLDMSSDALATLNMVLIGIKHLLALFGSLVIFIGALYVMIQFLYQLIQSRHYQLLDFDRMRLGLTRSLALGIEFIIAADVIQTLTTPDYYAVGILASLAVIRAFLNYFLNKELNDLVKRENQLQNASENIESK
ncbi:MAG: DUF1622 domain-containing protein [Chlamydiales bacterium]